MKEEDLQKMQGYNPMLANDDEEEEKNVIEKNYIVAAKSDDGKTFYVLSKNAQSTLKQYEEGKKMNTRNNPIIDKYEKFTVDGKEVYGVDMKKYGAVGSANSSWFDTYKWEFDPNTKEARYYGGETDLARLYDNMDVPKGYEDYMKKDTSADEMYFNGQIP